MMRGVLAAILMSALVFTSTGCKTKTEAEREQQPAKATEGQPAKTTEDTRPRKPEEKPARTATGLTMLARCALDFGEDGTIYSHEEGVLAKDDEGNLWESRKMTDAPDSKIGFFRKRPSAAKP